MCFEFWELSFLRSFFSQVRMRCILKIHVHSPSKSHDSSCMCVVVDLLGDFLDKQLFIYRHGESLFSVPQLTVLPLL